MPFGNMLVYFGEIFSETRKKQCMLGYGLELQPRMAVHV